MGIYNALFTGASGLTAFGEGVRVIGDNIANVTHWVSNPRTLTLPMYWGRR